MSHAAANPILRLAADPDDRQAWGAAVEVYGNLCWRIALHMLHNEDAAADAVQDSLLAVRAAARRFRTGADPDAAAVAWVARIAVNTCHNHRRRRHAAAPLPVDLPAPLPVEDDEALPQLQAALADLPANLREAVELRYLASLDYEQVGTALGIAPGAARVRVHRGVEALRGLLDRRGVAMSGLALAGLLDHLAESAVPVPSAGLTAGWNAAALPPVAAATAISTGVLITMSSLIVAAGIVLTLTLSEQTPPTPPPAPAPVPVPTPVQVDEALVWFSQQQQADGSWTLQVGKPAGEGERILSTSLATLTFLGAGYEAESTSQYLRVVKPAITWLAAHRPGQEASTALVAMRTMVLSENFAMTGTPRYRAAAEAAVADLLTRRAGQGWSKTVDDHDTDTQTTVLAAMAIKSAQGAGIEVGKTLDQLREWVSHTWQVRVAGTGFPARTAIFDVAVGPETNDVAGMIVAIFTAANTDWSDPAWLPLAERSTVSPFAAGNGTAADPLKVWLTQLAALQVGGNAWTRQQQERPKLATLLQECIAAGDIGGAAYAQLGQEVHYRFQRFQAINDPATKHTFKLVMPDGTEVEAKPAPPAPPTF